MQEGRDGTMQMMVEIKSVKMYAKEETTFARESRKRKNVKYMSLTLWR